MVGCVVDHLVASQEEAILLESTPTGLSAELVRERLSRSTRARRAAQFPGAALVGAYGASQAAAQCCRTAVERRWPMAKPLKT